MVFKTEELKIYILSWSLINIPNAENPSKSQQNILTEFFRRVGG